MSRRKKWLMVSAAPALFAMMGPTQCQYFGQVTVPAVDTNAPTIGTRMFFFGEEELGLWPLYRETSNPNAVFVIYPFGYDSGGVRRVELVHSISVRCADQTGFSIHLVPVVEEQAGGVGSLVSDGIYLDGGARRFGELTHLCGQVDEIVYNWGISAEDFNGNVTEGPGGVVVYIPG